MRRLLAIFAHPDDEGAISGTLARYARQGAEAMLICATRGEAGQISDPALATPETLGEVRTAELEAACQIIGIRELHFLDYRDSGMAGTPDNENPHSLVQANPEEAIERLVALIRQLKPDIVITFEPFGWYGHPDHQAVTRFATAAFERAADSTTHPAAGEPWHPQRLFYTVLPISNFQVMLDYARANNIDFGGLVERLPVDILKETEAQVTHIVDVRNFFEIKQEARWVHRTQNNPDSPFTKLPEELIRQMSQSEHFIQVYPARSGQQYGADLFEDK